MKVPDAGGDGVWRHVLESYSPLPSSSVKPTVAPFIGPLASRRSPSHRCTWGFPAARRSRLLIAWPSRATVMVLDFTSTVETRLAADLEGHGLLLDAEDAVRSLDAVEAQLQGDGGAALPVARGPVQALGVEPGRRLPGRCWRSRYAGWTLLVRDRLVELIETGHPDTDGWSRPGGEVPDEARSGETAGEGAVSRASRPFESAARRRSCTAGGPLQLVRGLPASRRPPACPRPAPSGGGCDLGHLRQLALGDADLGALLMLASVAPFFGLIAICASERPRPPPCRRPATTPRCRCSPRPPLSPSSVQAESTSTPPSRGHGHDALAAAVLHHTLLHRCRFPQNPPASDGPPGGLPRRRSKNTRKGWSCPHPGRMWGHDASTRPRQRWFPRPGPGFRRRPARRPVRRWAGPGPVLLTRHTRCAGTSPSSPSFFPFVRDRAAVSSSPSSSGKLLPLSSSRPPRRGRTRRSRCSRRPGPARPRAPRRPGRRGRPARPRASAAVASACIRSSAVSPPRAAADGLPYSRRWIRGRCR
ncbi:hypothetical protein SGRI78S_03209 [Streptomyces griseus subsp. griseus]